MNLGVRAAGSFISTAWTAGIALSWFGGFLAVSTLANALYTRFDEWFLRVAEVLRPPLAAILEGANVLDVQIILVFITLGFFALAGLWALLRGRESSPGLWSGAGLLLLSAMLGYLTLVKLQAVANQTSLLEQLHLQFFTGSHAIPYVIGFVASLVTFVVVRSVTRWGWFSYFVGLSVYVLMSELLRQSLTTSPGIADETAILETFQHQFFELSFSVRELLVGALFLLPTTLLALNPNRLKQVASLLLFFAILAFASIPFSRLFPEIVPRFERSTDDQVSYYEGGLIANAFTNIYQERVVILLQGRNVFGDQIYSYLELTLADLIRLREVMRAQEEFLPTDYGRVIAAGKGEPSQELRQELAEEFNMIDVPRPAVPNQGEAE